MAPAVGWQRIEGGLVFFSGLALYDLGPEPFVWWLAIPAFFLPDLSFAAYLGGRRLGAMVYNALHIYGLGAVLLFVGLSADLPLAAGLGALWLAHSGFDRMLGYGLKLPEGFAHTHLGPIGRRDPS
jgi:hypothetical protein